MTTDKDTIKLSNFDRLTAKIVRAVLKEFCRIENFSYKPTFKKISVKTAPIRQPYVDVRIMSVRFMCDNVEYIVKIVFEYGKENTTSICPLAQYDRHNKQAVAIYEHHIFLNEPFCYKMHRHRIEWKNTSTVKQRLARTANWIKRRLR